LAFPEARKYIDAGEMISDSVVGDVLLQQLLSPFVGEPGKEFGVLVDGFPRTALQVGGPAARQRNEM
jgi:adenylate kinase family enzyme